VDRSATGSIESRDASRHSAPDGDGVPRPGASPRRLTAFYVALALLAVGASGIVLHAGRHERAQPSIAGTYEANAPSACLGGAPRTRPAFSLRQSGQFVSLTNQHGSVGGELRLSAGPPRRAYGLTGSVRCADGGSERFRGSIRPGAGGELAGVLGGDRLTATLRHDPPEPGTPTPRAPGDLDGLYALSPRSTCFGGRFELSGDGSALSVRAADQRLGRLSYRKRTGELTGTVRCVRGGTARLSAVAVDRTLTDVTVLPVGAPRGPGDAAGAHLPRQGERFTATKQRELFGQLVAAFFLAAAVVMIVAHLFGWVAVRLSQPRVMGEVVAGIALGPTIFGAMAPELQSLVFPTDILPAFGVAANLGLVFYMALVGLELDRGELRGRMSQALAISNMSVAVPMVLGLVVALPLYPLLAPDTPFAAFALFMGVAMSITAFPVLARILAERRMLRRPVGALALTCAAVDDVTAWFLIALASAVAVAEGSGEVVRTVVLAAAFCVVMLGLVRPALARLTARIEAAGRVPGGWIAAVFAGILLSAYVSETIGVAVIFGAFVMGLVMPRDSPLTRDVTRRIEDFVVILLLPLFFAYTGLRTDIGLLDRPVLWLIGLLLLAVAIVGKFVGAIAAARLTGFGWRPAAVLGTLMNTRGLTELIVLNLALEKGVISDALFAMLVIMALVTTFMAGPLLRLLDPENTYGAPVAEELREPRPATAPERSILVSPRSAGALRQLRALAEPLARTEPPREVIVAQLVSPARGVESGALQSETESLRDAAREVTFARLDLIDTGVFARGVAFTSTHVAKDLIALARAEAVDLVLLDGRVRGDVATVVERAEGCVAVLTADPAAEVVPRGDRGVLVPFGADRDDRAALELGARLAAACSARLRVTATDERALAEANLLAQRHEGVIVEPVPAGREADGIAASALVVAGIERGATDIAPVTLLVHGELAPTPRPVDGASPALAIPSSTGPP
jgi:Kef-type K+ transport system membrane component KefB